MRAFTAILEEVVARRVVSWLVAAAAALLGCGGPVRAPGPLPPSSVGGAATPAVSATGGSGTDVLPSQVGDIGGAAFTCDEGAHAEPTRLRRLTMTQYQNTLRDLTAWALSASDDAEVALGEAGLGSLPADRRAPTKQDPHGSYRRLDQAIDQSHVEETYRVATSLASALTTPDRLGRVAGACSIDGDLANDGDCLSSFIHTFGARALRRPLDADDEAFYRAVYGSDPTANPAAYADTITVMLSAPEFLYFVEHGEAEAPGQPGTFELSPYELASRLSYHFWQTLPDDTLWAAAEDGSLLDPAVLAAQVERLLVDPRARATMAELFEDFLKLEDLPALDVHTQDPVLAAFAGSDLPGPELRQHAIDEALDMLAYYTWTAPAGVEALFASELSFARAEDLAQLYGVEPWDGRVTPPALPRGERPGLLSRLWFLASGSANTRPIRRGVFIRRYLLCDELAPPPANANAVVPPLRMDQTTRQVVEELTEQPNTVCASCHATVINPLGFAFEGFDALGRVRAEQRLFNDDGVEVGALPIDTSTVPQVIAGDSRVSNGHEELIRLMLESGKIEACLARQYFRFTFGRYEDMAYDGCALERLRARLVESGRIRELLKEVALLPEMRQRRFEAGP